MACKCKWNECYCLSLSKRCLIFGILNLASTIYFIVSDTTLFHQNHGLEQIIYNVIALIDICTCLFMMSGSLLEHRWPMIPYIVCKILLIGCFSAIVVMLTINSAVNKVMLETLVPTIVCYIILVLSILYWDITFKRYLEIKERKLVTPTYYIEME